jgi:hypothetical protein
MMEFCPRLDKALLRSRQSAADTLNRTEGERCLGIPGTPRGSRPVMWCTDFWKHADDDSKEA